MVDLFMNGSHSSHELAIKRCLILFRNVIEKSASGSPFIEQTSDPARARVMDERKKSV